MSKTILSVEGMSCPSCISHDATVSSGQLIAALHNVEYEAMPRRDRLGNV
jgi:hypothetical protein